MKDLHRNQSLCCGSILNKMADRLTQLQDAINEKKPMKTKMAGDGDVEVPAEKRLKQSDDCNNGKDHGEAGVEVPLKTFDSFVFGRVLSEIADKKVAFIQGKFEGSTDDAVVILEKTHFKPDVLEQILTKETSLNNTQHNDIYSTYEGFPEPKLNTIRTTLIYPATQTHIDKYSTRDVHMIDESAEDYRSITKSHIEANALAPTWVYNILEKKSEVELIIFEDPDPKTGFILLPNFKWNREQIADLHLLAIVHTRDIRSLRDLNDTHLPLLENMETKVKKAVKDEFKLPASQLRLFFHYQPSYYHLHLHISHVKFDAPGMSTGRGHLLREVMENIRFKSDYYQGCTMNMLLSDTDKLYAEFKEAGKIET